MRAKIVEIGKEDGFCDRSDLVGMVGDWVPNEWQAQDDLESGCMNLDDSVDGSKYLYFAQVKMAPLDTDRTDTIIRHGHPDFYRLCEEEMDLHSRKNHDYAAGGNPLGNFNRVSAILAMYPGLELSDPAVVAITYMMKQLDASLWMLSNGHVAKVEGQKERWQDISIYSKIISILISEGGRDAENKRV